MSGLLDYLMPQSTPWALNPDGSPGTQAPPALPAWAQWLQSNKNALSGAFGGIVGATNPHDAVAGFTKGLAQGRPQDTQDALIKQQQDQQAAAQKQTTAQQNATLKYLQDRGRSDLVAAVMGGMPIAEAWKKALETDAYTLGPQDTRIENGQVVAQGQPTTKTESAPNGYRYNADGTLSFIPGGPADPATAGKTTEATRRNQQLATVIVPELKSLIGDAGRPGTFDKLADLSEQAKGAVPFGIGNFLTSPEYQQAQNSMRTIVASYLYSVSGATANPGEVENQVSVLTPKAGDSPQTVAAKKARLQDMVQAVVAAASGTPITVDASQLPSLGQQPTSSGDPQLDQLLQKYGGP